MPVVLKTNKNVLSCFVHIVLLQQEKHSKICQKSATKKRKVFDSSRQRAEGTDIPVLKPIKPKVSLHLSRAMEIHINCQQWFILTIDRIEKKLPKVRKLAGSHMLLKTLLFIFLGNLFIHEYVQLLLLKNDLFLIWGYLFSVVSNNTTPKGNNAVHIP